MRTYGVRNVCLINIVQGYIYKGTQIVERSHCTYTSLLNIHACMLPEGG